MSPRRLLIVATTTGYQTRSFEEAAADLGVELVYATDRCHHLDDPWRDGAIAIRFHEEEAAARAIVESARVHPIDGVIAVGDRPTVIAALAARDLHLPGNPPEAAAISRNKRLLRERLHAAGLPAPWFISRSAGDAPPNPISFPCIVKPVILSGSRGVIRADDARELAAAVARIERLLRQPDIAALRDPAAEELLIEEFIPGREYAVEALLEEGRLRTLAIFDKPNPLDGPFFEETIYVTPPKLSSPESEAITKAVAAAVEAIGLHHGPIHAECRVNADGVFVLEVAARPIGGLCARAIRMVDPSLKTSVSLEYLLLRHALGHDTSGFVREPSASGVMMMPIVSGGIYRGVDGVEEARQVPFIEAVHITAKTDQRLVPLPEGASYLGFIFARAATSDAADAALRQAHATLRFTIDREIAVNARAG
jgi:biotin carboxylase